MGWMSLPSAYRAIREFQVCGNGKDASVFLRLTTGALLEFACNSVSVATSGAVTSTIEPHGDTALLIGYQAEGLALESFECAYGRRPPVEGVPEEPDDGFAAAWQAWVAALPDAIEMAAKLRIPIDGPEYVVHVRARLRGA
jgi:hypothetical protein